jgi:serine/threonine protein kinase
METFLNNRYQVGERIGAGSFGAVYECFDTKKQVQLAVKVEDKL